LKIILIFVLLINACTLHQKKNIGNSSICFKSESNKILLFVINHLEANKKIKMENTPPTFIQAFNALFDFFDHMDKNWLFQVIIAFVTFMFIWENYLSYRSYF